uniref:Integrase catalytic domain-containing protein n=1 Tax=Periophthalmus magnuspinnatus TaxID=409849 RepID=A0A3B3ZDY7_9GOBI
MILNLPSKTAHSVIQKMKSVFARHVIPKETVSDHVPFLTFSSPGFPSSNGMAERAIKTVTHALKKALLTGIDAHLVLLSLRNTPVIGLNVSPAQMLMGRVLHSTLPCTSAVLKQSTPQDVYNKEKSLDSDLEELSSQTPESVGPSTHDPPDDSSKDTPKCYTHSGCAVRCPARYND